MALPDRTTAKYQPRAWGIAFIKNLNSIGTGVLANDEPIALFKKTASVTNVQFFSGATSLGNVTTAPFNFTANNLAAGNYSFTAKAFDNLGATTNSAAVNIFVQTNATITSSALLTGGSFQFTLNSIAGQTDAIETSPNMLNWSALFTNVAPANVFNVTDVTSTNVLRRFYRTRQDL